MTVSDNECYNVRRIEQIEERLRGAELGMASLTVKLQVINDNLKEDIGHTRIDLRERISELKQDIKDDFKHVSASIDALSANINAVNDSLQNLYITNSGAAIKVNVNEKIIWAIAGITGTGGLYLLQEFLRAGGS